MKKPASKLDLWNPFPKISALKNVINGIMSQPQQRPHISKRAFGYEANKKIPQKPVFYSNFNQNVQFEQIIIVKGKI